MERGRFESNIEGFATFRPTYPDSILRPLCKKIPSVAVIQGSPVVDVGSGIGIFSRQLAERLPVDIPLIGIEPTPAMRQRAIASGCKNFAYIEGVAEDLPIADATARAVVAATAAHWFDRPAFYREARRCLAPGGIFAIAEYVRDETNSPAARGVIDFLDRCGEARAYERPDYANELRRIEGFSALEEVKEVRTLSLSIREYVGLALSSSHARPAIVRLGRQGAEAEVAALAERLLDGAGRVPFGYAFQLSLAEAR